MWDTWQLVDCHLDSGGTVSQLAGLLGVSLSHVRSLVRRRQRIRAGEQGPRMVPEYTCPGCKQRVTWSPCQVCTALSAARATIRTQGRHAVNLPWWAE